MPHDVRAMIIAWESVEVMDESSLIQLRRLTRKAEVTGKLFAEYNDDFTVPEHAVPLGMEAVERIMAVIIRNYRHSRDLKLLNSVLKIADGILKIPPYKADLGLWAQIDAQVKQVRFNHADH